MTDRDKAALLLPDLVRAEAQWAALYLFRGDERADSYSGYHLHGFELSSKSFALLFADASWLMTLNNKNE